MKKRRKLRVVNGRHREERHTAVSDNRERVGVAIRNEYDRAPKRHVNA
jgi:hypothetical protein